ncbi:MAG: NADH-quinone oxidoreductase subunit L [Dehalococcoidales bacterium]|nr:NADH-quinone oxidoreductase subunit L [Dehalococcoidales bacterium]
MPAQLVWFIFFLPLASFAIISLFIRPFVKAESKVAGYITIVAIGAATVLSYWTLFTVIGAHEHQLEVAALPWLSIGGVFDFNVGLIIDSLTAVMLVVVSTVSFMVQIYSQGYMKGDTGYHRYYAWMSLFTMSMLGLVMANNLLFMFIFWEMVGLCSYLLIGFWFHRPSAANAAKKAFIVTRIGDFGFLAGILILFANTGTFDIAHLHEMAIGGLIGGSVLTWAAIGIFAGAVGKSAQFPLHVWLPDAMEGPTPVSALIHAATMVAAGVFLVARTLPLFVCSEPAVMTVAIIGGFTAIFAAAMGLVMNDIKRVVAYSTISQLGYMMLALGAAGLGVARGGDITIEAAKAAAAVGIFHLFNHAFFKALLFLGSGSVNHATGTFDMRLMGGLKKVMPWTYATFLIAAISLAGIWPFAGFWSKDEILAVALQDAPILFVLAIITVFMTAFYIFRVVFLTFGGEYRGGAQQDAGHGHEEHHHLHESPAVMVVPMVILAVFAIFSGFWNVTGGFASFMGEGETHGFWTGLFGIFTHPLPWISLVVAGAGIFLAYAIYSKKWLSAEKIGAMFKPLYTLFYNKYYMDVLYEDIIVRKFLMGGLFRLAQLFDTYIIDGIVNGFGKLAVATGRGVRHWQTGQLQLYGIFMGIGVIAIVIVVFIFG